MTRQPRLGLATRISVLLLVALLAALTVYAVANHADRQAGLAGLESTRIAGRVAAVYRVVDASDAALRPELAALLSGPVLTVALGEGPPALRLSSEPAAGMAAMVAAEIEARLGLRPRIMVVSGSWADGPDRSCDNPACDMAEALAEGPRLAIMLRLGDGTPLRFEAGMAPPFDPWTPGMLAWLMLGVGAVAGGAVWGVGRILRPLDRFTAAAERIGADLDAPPVPELGMGEVRRAAQAINLLQRRLRAQLDDRTEMLAAISHDLRTPLTRARLRADAVGDGGLRGALHAEFDEMDAMIGSILSFLREKDGEGPSELVDVTAMAQTICDAMADVGHKVTLAAGGRESLRCRPVAVRRCLSNLIENAVAHGCNVEVAVGRDAGGALTITVDDDGPGIPAERREEAFKPFVRLQPARGRDAGAGGVGLGLAIARGVARAHGGDVRLEDGPGGRGLRARVTLLAIR